MTFSARRARLPFALGLAAAALLSACSSGTQTDANPGQSGSASPGSASANPACADITAGLSQMSAQGQAAVTAMSEGRTADALAAVDAAADAAGAALNLLPGVPDADKTTYLSTFATMRDVVNAHASTPVPQDQMTAALQPVVDASQTEAAVAATDSIGAIYTGMCPQDTGAGAEPSTSSPAPQTTQSDAATSPPASTPAPSGNVTEPGTAPSGQ